MSKNWNQPKCEACWIRDNTVETDATPLGIGVRKPVRLRDAPLERCAWCGNPTISGIYVREDPDTLPYPSQEVVDV